MYSYILLYFVAYFTKKLFCQAYCNIRNIVAYIGNIRTVCHTKYT